MPILLRRLSTLHPQMAMKKSSACSSLRQSSSSCLATSPSGSSSLLISLMSVSPNRSKSLSSFSTACIMLLFIFFATKIEVTAETSKNICISQDNPGIVNNLVFEEQVITENKKKPDFIFPDGHSYHNFMFPSDKLTMLGAKTTCKDRWRQVLNEADRIPNKHLFTLQRGVTRNQLQEMRDEHLTLVVPKHNKSLFLPEFHDSIMCLADFIGMVKERQN